MSEARERLAVVVELSTGGSINGRSSADVAKELLPVVQALMDEHAAAELEVVRQWLMETGRADADTLQQIRERIGQHREATT